jgi:microcystin-dependent protein
LFGGYWIKLLDRFLIGAGNTYDVRSADGETGHILKAEEMPSHRHAAYIDVGSTSIGKGYSLARAGSSTALRYSQNLTGYAGGTGASETTAGTVQPHNNMPPFHTVYIWKRIV